MKGSKILGEKENLIPGKTDSFSLRLAAGLHGLLPRRHDGQGDLRGHRGVMTSQSEPRLTRRGLLGFGAVGGAALAGGVVGGLAVGRTSPASAATAAAEPFHGVHQSGIATSAQDRLRLRDLRRHLDRPRRARGCCALDRCRCGDGGGGAGARPSDVLLAPPADTGEAVGLAPARLTVTVGFGPTCSTTGSVSRRAGRPRSPRCPRCPVTCSRRPAPAATSPSRPAPTTPRSPSTPSATSHAWAAGSSSCAGRSSASAVRRPRVESQETARNLMGFKDGTRNVLAEDSDAMAAHVWVGSEADQDWMRDGSYQVPVGSACSSSRGTGPRWVTSSRPSAASIADHGLSPYVDKDGHTRHRARVAW